MDQTEQYESAKDAGERHTSGFRRIWQGWKKLARLIGDVIGRVVLSAFYITILAPFGLGVRFFGDPLGLAASRSNHWKERESPDASLEGARRLF